MLWGVLAVLLRFVPYIGAPLAALFPLALAAAVDPGWSMVLWTAGAVRWSSSRSWARWWSRCCTATAPACRRSRWWSRRSFWTWLWGPIGLILSTPLTLCLVVLGRHVERLEFLDVLLGDRPALTPVESFYQRMLAGDPDEAIDQAELLLRDRPLSSYYDEVALKGLQLAAARRRARRADREQLERIKDAIAEPDRGSRRPRRRRPRRRTRRMTAPPAPSRAEQRRCRASPRPTTPPPEPDALPEAWRGGAPVLCIAGRGPLDEAAAGMLAQLLTQARAGRPGGAARRRLARRHRARSTSSGVAMVCISYLEITGTPSHLRYLLRRLRQRLPGAPMLVGLWPAEEAVLRDDRLRAAVGADYYATSLREA